MSRLMLGVLGLGILLNASVAGAQNEVGLPAGTPQVTSIEEVSVSRWLMRLHDAARSRTYAGTFVVTAGDTLSTSRIWHVCDGQQQIERVDALTGTARSTFRRNEQVMTFLPDRRVVISETRDSLGLFPNLLNRADSSIARYYRLKTLGQERVAGLTLTWCNWCRSMRCVLATRSGRSVKAVWWSNCKRSTRPGACWSRPRFQNCS